MKKYIELLILLILASGYCFAQSENWKLFSVTRPLTNIDVISSTKMRVLSGTVNYTTSNQGLNWNLPVTIGFNIGGTYVSDFLSPDVTFYLDSLRGWACQHTDKLLKTVDGGNSWASINTNIYFSSRLNTVFFINNNTGWAGGVSNKGIIIKTTNGGSNWVIQDPNIVKEIANIYMLDSLKGFYCAHFSDSIGMTTDGGNVWTKQKVGNGQEVKRIIFKDKLNGWALGGYGFILRTTNGGLNWNYYSTPVYSALNIYFLDLLTGWITSGSGYIWKSTNSGLNWFNQTGVPDTGYMSPFASAFDVYFKDVNTGWVVKGNGMIKKTTNGGNNWINQVASPIGHVLSLDFKGSKGWALTNHDDGDDFTYVYCTPNLGYTWNRIFILRYVNMNSLAFVNDITGYMCGNSEVIMKTVNSGYNWANINYGSATYKSITFLNESTGYVCGELGLIIKTTNGGMNWINQQSNTSNSVNDVFFVDSQNGYAACDGGNILKTTNAGQNWNLLYPLDDKNYNAVQFINANTGFATGNKLEVSGPPWFYTYSVLVVVKTTNGGSNWSPSLQESFEGIAKYNNVLFANENMGWVLIEKSGKSYISKTTNSGVNWFQTHPYGSEFALDEKFNCIYSIDEQHTWVGGTNGTLLSTSPLIGIQNINAEIPHNFVLSQNYPNPFNPQTKIKFAVPKESFTKLIIYDLLGREVATLVNEELKPGTYQADWDCSNYSSGVYFYKIISGDFTETKKMVLMK